MGLRAVVVGLVAAAGLSGALGAPLALPEEPSAAEFCHPSTPGLMCRMVAGGRQCWEAEAGEILDARARCKAKCGSEESCGFLTYEQRRVLYACLDACPDGDDSNETENEIAANKKFLESAQAKNAATKTRSLLAEALQRQGTENLPRTRA